MYIIYMALTSINSNFSTLNNNLELLRQSQGNQIITQNHYNHQFNNTINGGSVIIDLWENGVKKYKHIVLIGGGWGQMSNNTDFHVVYQESNNGIHFFSNGIRLNLKHNPVQGNFTYYFTERNILSRYCRVFSTSFYMISSLTSIKSTL